MNKNLVFTAILSIGILLNANAQNNQAQSRNNSNLLVGIGWTAFGEFGSPAKYANYYYPNGDSIAAYKKTITSSNWTFLGIGVNIHYLIMPQAENSFSISTYPMIGFSIFRNYIGSFNMPLMFNYNLGCGSSYDSKRNDGLTIGAGAEFTKCGLIKYTEVSTDPNSSGFFGENKNWGYNRKLATWIQPCLNLGYRYFGRNDGAKEVNFKLGFLPTKVYDEKHLLPTTENKNFTSFWFRLSVVNYFGY